MGTTSAGTGRWYVVGEQHTRVAWFPPQQQEGPQLALYVPGPFLRAGSNEVVLLELIQEPQGNTSVSWADRIVWNSADPPSR